MDTIERLTKEKEHYISAWADACNENQCLRNDLEKLRTYHFEQNERMCKEAKTMRDALHAVVKAMLPANATPTMLRRFGAPLDCGVGRLDPERAKPRIKPLRSGGWLCEGGNLGGTGWNPSGAYHAWLWNMVHHASERRLIEFGLTR